MFSFLGRNAYSLVALLNLVCHSRDDGVEHIPSCTLRTVSPTQLLWSAVSLVPYTFKRPVWPPGRVMPSPAECAADWAVTATGEGKTLIVPPIRTKKS